MNMLTSYKTYILATRSSDLSHCNVTVIDHIYTSASSINIISKLITADTSDICQSSVYLISR